MIRQPETLGRWQCGGLGDFHVEFAARRTAQHVFERVMFDKGEELATADVLHGIRQTRRTLTTQLVEDFEHDISDYARV